MIVAPFLLAACSAAQATVGRGTPTPPTPSPPPSPAFVGSVRWIDDQLRDELIGRNWHPGCPVPIRDLRLVTVSYWTFGGRVKQGPLIINETVADDVLTGLKDGQVRLANEQARYEIAFRQDLATLAEQIKRPRAT